MYFLLCFQGNIGVIDIQSVISPLQHLIPVKPEVTEPLIGRTEPDTPPPVDKGQSETEKQHAPGGPDQSEHNEKQSADKTDQSEPMEVKDSDTKQNDELVNEFADAQNVTKEPDAEAVKSATDAEAGTEE